MNLPPPIVVLGTPRSGTSLTASMLEACGVFTGRCRAPDAHNPSGYFENEALLDLRGSVTRDRVVSALIAQGWNGGSWLVKHAPGSWDAWACLDPLYVLVRRDRRDCLRSWAGKDRSPVHLLSKKIAAHNHILDHVREHHGGVDFWPQAVIDGDWSGFEHVCERVGLSFDHEAAAARVRPELWT